MDTSVTDVNENETSRIKVVISSIDEKTVEILKSIFPVNNLPSNICRLFWSYDTINRCEKK